MTIVPARPLVGEKLVTESVGVKLAVLVASFPAGVDTEIRPVEALFGTIAWICVGDTSVNAAALAPNFTLFTAQKFVPLTVTVVPVGPLAGVKPEMVGCGAVDVRENRPVLALAWPAEFVTRTVPDVGALEGTVARIDVDDSTLYDDPTVPNRTPRAPEKPIPEIVTAVPAGPHVGVKPVTDSVTVKADALVTVSPDAVTAMAPLVAPAGTVARSCVADTT